MDLIVFFVWIQSLFQLIGNFEDITKVKHTSFNIVSIFFNLFFFVFTTPLICYFLWDLVQNPVQELIMFTLNSKDKLFNKDNYQKYCSLKPSYHKYLNSIINKNVSQLNSSEKDKYSTVYCGLNGGMNYMYNDEHVILNKNIKENEFNESQFQHRIDYSTKNIKEEIIEELKEKISINVLSKIHYTMDHFLHDFDINDILYILTNYSKAHKYTNCVELPDLLTYLKTDNLKLCNKITSLSFIIEKNRIYFNHLNRLVTYQINNNNIILPTRMHGPFYYNISKNVHHINNLIENLYHNETLNNVPNLSNSSVCIDNGKWKLGHVCNVLDLLRYLSSEAMCFESMIGIESVKRDYLYTFCKDKIIYSNIKSENNLTKLELSSKKKIIVGLELKEEISSLTNISLNNFIKKLCGINKIFIDHIDIKYKPSYCNWKNFKNFCKDRLMFLTEHNFCSKNKKD